MYNMMVVVPIFVLMRCHCSNRCDVMLYLLKAFVFCESMGDEVSSCVCYNDLQ